MRGIHLEEEYHTSTRQSLLEPLYPQMSCSNWLKLFNNVGRSNTVGEMSGRINHSGLPQVALFVGSVRRRGIEGMSVHGCRLDSCMGDGQ